MKRIAIITTLIGVATIFLSCAPTGNLANDTVLIPVDTANTTVPAPLVYPSPKVNPSQISMMFNLSEDVEALVNGNNSFALDLFQRFRTSKDNVFYSPYSIYQALAMAYAGSAGTTATQMGNAMHLAPPGESLNLSFSDLDKKIKSLNDDANFQLNIANALWGLKDYKFLPGYIQEINNYYGGGLKSLDFINSPEASRAEINNWVSDQTKGRITDIIPSGSLNPMTRLIITNAIYFKARWAEEFATKWTTNDAFYPLTGGQVTVPIMHQTNDCNYAEGNDYQTVQLLYKGKNFAMTIVLPKEGQFDKFEQSLDNQKLLTILNSFSLKRVHLAMPKFKFETQLNLADTFSALGMIDPFKQSKADFSGITGNKELYVSQVLHKAFISVDEEGTEAAAATAVHMVGAPPLDIVEFTANRPFIFLIQDLKTGTILFMGRIANPA